MEQLLALYTSLVQGATDDQIATHLTNLVSDAVELSDATTAIVERARQRNLIAQTTTAAFDSSLPHPQGIPNNG